MATDRADSPSLPRPKYDLPLNAKRVGSDSPPADPATRRPIVTRCPVCTGSRLHYLFSVQHYRLVRCDQCALVLTDPQPSDAELNEIYNEDYFLVEKNEAGRQHVDQLKQGTADYYLDLLETYGLPPNARLLEIGCGQGDFLLQAKRRGMDVTGVEYSASACADARAKLGGEGRIVHGEVSALDAEAGRYDVCACSDVIEHVRDPRLFLERVHRLLKPGGVVFIATTSLDSWSARVMKKNWMEFKAEHLFYFKPANLETLLFDCGFAQTIERPCVKTLSLDYIAGHFQRYPVPGFTRLAAWTRRLLPLAWRRQPLRVVASGMILMARAQPKPEQRRLSLVVPAFNEAATFQTAFEQLLAKEVPGLEIEIVVVESNSTDGTRELVLGYQDHPRVKVVLEDRPHGKGHAVRAGLAHVTGDFIMIQDADLEYDLEDYEALLEPLVSGRAAFVLGARHGGKAWKMRRFSGQPLLSLVLNAGHWILTFLVNILFGVRLKDPFTMYKLFRRDCLYGLRFECDRFDFDYELLIKLLRKGYQPLEIPVNYRSRSFSEGKKVSFFRDPPTWVRALVKYRLARIDPLAEVARQHRQAALAPLVPLVTAAP